MDESNCFYCHTDIENHSYVAPFLQAGDHIEKPLCYDCYRDWLEGIKG
ncbi:hypothetical protein [Bacillus alkalicellulosilyticus]|nr:hypothetical protein [Bacillus alkalicellulosilyticus]